MDEFVNWVKGMGAASAAALGQPRFGVVTSYNPNDGTAKVTLQPEGTLTGWLPTMTHWVGSGWGMHTPFVGGEQVIVLPQDGDATSGVIVGRAWSDQMRPPAAAPGELWLVHQTGSFIKLLSDGSIASKGTWLHTGDMHVTGEVVRGWGTSDDVTLGGHTHDQGADSAGDGEVPTDPPNAGT